MENFLMIDGMGMEYIHGLMDPFILGHFGQVKCMVMAVSLILVELNTMESSGTVISMVTANYCIETGKYFTTESLAKALNMVLVQNFFLAETFDTKDFGTMWTIRAVHRD